MLKTTVTVAKESEVETVNMAYLNMQKFEVT